MEKNIAFHAKFRLVEEYYKPGRKYKWSLAEHFHRERTAPHKKLFPSRDHTVAYGRFTRAMKIAQKQGLRFYLTMQDYIDLPERKCVFCGTDAYEYYRIDRNEGFLRSNIASACSDCGSIRTRFRSDDDFKAYIASLHKKINRKTHAERLEALESAQWSLPI